MTVLCSPYENMAVYQNGNDSLFVGFVFCWVFLFVCLFFCFCFCFCFWWGFLVTYCCDEHLTRFILTKKKDETPIIGLHSGYYDLIDFKLDVTLRAF